MIRITMENDLCTGGAIIQFAKFEELDEIDSIPIFDGDGNKIESIDCTDLLSIELQETPDFIKVAPYLNGCLSEDQVKELIKFLENK